MNKGIIILSSLLLTGCMSQMIKDSTQAINQNRWAVEKSTETIRHNRELIAESTRAITENKQALDAMQAQ